MTVLELLAMMACSHWAIEPGYMQRLLVLAQEQLAGGVGGGGADRQEKMRVRKAPAAGSAMAALAGGQAGSVYGLQTVGSVSVIDVWGVLAKNPFDSWGDRIGTSYQEIRTALAVARADQGTKTILIRMDSPGGEAVPVETAAMELLAIADGDNGNSASQGGGGAGGKPVVVVGDGLIASAAFYLASQATAIYATPGTQVGSIGTRMDLVNYEKLLADIGIKVETIKSPADGPKDAGSPYRAMTPQERKLLQAEVDSFNQQFVAAVMRGRGADRAKVESWQQVRVLMAQQAQAAGMIDGVVNSVEQMLALLNTAPERVIGKGGGGGGGGSRKRMVALGMHTGGRGGGTPVPPDAIQDTSNPGDATGSGESGHAGQLAGEPAEGDMFGQKRRGAMAGVALLLATAGAMVPEAMGQAAGGTAGGVAAPGGVPGGAPGAGLAGVQNAVGGGTGGGGGGTPQPGPGPGPGPGAALPSLADERRRQSMIRSRAGLPIFANNPDIAALATRACDEGWTPEQFSDQAMQRIAVASPPTNHVPAGGDAGAQMRVEVAADQRDRRAEVTSLALISNYAPQIRLAAEGPGERAVMVAQSLGFNDQAACRTAFRAADSSGIRSHRLRDVMLSCAMRATGCSSVEQLQSRFPSMAGAGLDGSIFAASFHGSSDFPAILGATVNKSLIAAFMELGVVWDQFCSIGSQSDFKDQTVVGLSEAPNLELIAEGQTPGEATFNERKNTINIKTYGKRTSFSWQTMVNDDLGAFLRVGQMVGQATRRLPESLFFTLLNLSGSGNGPVLADGVRLAAESRDNLAAAGGAISDTTIDAAYVAMKTRKGIGKDKDKTGAEGVFIEVQPDRMLVPTSKFRLARQWYANQYKPGGSVHEMNMVQGLLRPVDSPRLSSTTGWWVFANPSLYEVFRMNFYNGQQTPSVDVINDGDPLSRRTQYTLPGCGCAAVDSFGVYYNPGA